MDRPRCSVVVGGLFLSRQEFRACKDQRHTNGARNWRNDRVCGGYEGFELSFSLLDRLETIFSVKMITIKAGL